MIKVCYLSFLYISICMENVFPFLTFCMCVSWLAVRPCFVWWLWFSRGWGGHPVWLAVWPRGLRPGAGTLVGGAVSMCGFLCSWGYLWQGPCMDVCLALVASGLVLAYWWAGCVPSTNMLEGGFPKGPCQCGIIVVKKAFKNICCQHLHPQGKSQWFPASTGGFQRSASGSDPGFIQTTSSVLGLGGCEILCISCKREVSFL